MIITHFIDKIQDEKIISKEALFYFIEQTFKHNPANLTEYRGYDVRNSIQNFLGYVLNLLDEEKKFRLHFSKGEVYSIFCDQGYPVKELMTGSYKNELFFVSGIDNAEYNKNLIRYICDITQTMNTRNYTIEEPFKNAYELYKLISIQHKLNRNESLVVMFNYIAQHNLFDKMSFSSNKLLFSHYNPLELYESWYISDIIFN